MGIEIEFDRDEEDDQYSQLEYSQNDIEVAAADSTTNQGTQEARERRRRNSESTVWDLGIEAQSQSRKRRNSFSTVSKVRDQIGGIPEFLQESPPAPPSPIYTSADRNQNEEYSTDNVRPWLNSRMGMPRRGRGRSVSTHASIRIRRRSTSLAHAHQRPETDQSVPASDDYQGISENTAVTSVLGEDDTMGSAKPFQGYIYNQVNPGLMETKASLILEHHLFFLAKHLLRLWKDKALQLREDSRGLELIAINRDKKVLLGGALADWRLRLQSRRSIVETERFFSHLERRATRARDLYLMHVAFTHWSACANEQVQRTALARRHIVRTRVFNAWRDITAVNELKVRRQVLKKFFVLWKHEYVIRTRYETAALQKYHDNLAERVYWTWARKHKEITAIAWWAEGIKRRTLFRWIFVSHNAWEDQRTAEDTRRFQLMRNTWRIWKAKTDEHLKQCSEAEAFYHAQTCCKPLRRWRRETRVIPARKIVQTDIRTRLLRGTFEIWHHRSQQERQAATVDRMRIIREAWTNWRHKSRSQVVSACVDARILSQSIYKWVLTARCAAARRNADGQIKYRSFQIWLYRSQGSRERRLDQEDMAHSFVVHRTQDLVLKTWYSQMEHLRQLDHTAAYLYAPRLLHGVISQWSERAQHFQQLEQWSRDARFYFPASKSLKRWKASTESARREKRKIAYTQVRRIKKMNLAREFLRNWQRQAKELLDRQDQAQQMRHNRNVIAGMNIFDRWRARAEEFAEMEALCRETIFRKHFALWRDRSNAFQELRTEAIITYQEHRQNRAVKKWSLQALQLRAQSNYALEIREKNTKRTFRKIFTYWHQRAPQIRPTKKPDNPEPGQLGSTARAEAWSDFGEELEVDDWAGGLDEETAPTLIPGYLSTPSKRTERVMAVAARLSTTPRAPLPTPFERQLRAQYSGALQPSLRKPLVRSTLGMGGGFADIPDRSNDR
jgi:protein SFI1